MITRTVENAGDVIVERALNWRELEHPARTWLKLQETPVTGAVYTCPPELAAQAQFASDMESEAEGDPADWVSLAEAQRCSCLSLHDIRAAIARGRLDVRTRLLGGRRGRAVQMVRRSQLADVWPAPDANSPNDTNWGHKWRAITRKLEVDEEAVVGPGSGRRYGLRQAIDAGGGRPRARGAATAASG